MNLSDRKTAEGMLFTDEYQLTMAQLYYRMGLHERRVQFDHFFRSYPDYGAHQAGYCINAGLEWLLDWMLGAHFREEDIDYLRGQTGRTGERLFAGDFLDWLLEHGTFGGIDLRAIPEGRVWPAEGAGVWGQRWGAGGPYRRGRFHLQCGYLARAGLRW